MKKDALLTLVALSLVSLFSCGKAKSNTSSNPTSGSETSSKIPYEEGSEYNADLLKAEVGYPFTLPQDLLSKTNLKIVDVDGKTELKVEYGKVTLPHTGLAKATYDGGETKIQVVDTEKPMFLPLSGQKFDWIRTYPYYIYKGDTVDLNHIFVATDNSGEKPTTWFECYYLGTEKVELTEGSKFVSRGGKAAEKDYYYDVIAHAKDASGNAVYMTQRLDVTMSSRALKEEFEDDAHPVKYIVEPDQDHPYRTFDIPDSECPGYTKYDKGTNMRVEFDLLTYYDAQDQAQYEKYKANGRDRGNSFYGRLHVNNTSVFGYAQPKATWDPLVWTHVLVQASVQDPFFIEGEDYGQISGQKGLSLFFTSVSNNDIFMISNLKLTKI